MNERYFAAILLLFVFSERCTGLGTPGLWLDCHKAVSRPQITVSGHSLRGLAPERLECASFVLLNIEDGVQPRHLK